MMGIKNELAQELRRIVFEEFADRSLMDADDPVEALVEHLEVTDRIAHSLLTDLHDAETWIAVIEKMQLPVRVMVARQKPHAQESIDMETGRRPSPQWDGE